MEKIKAADLRRGQLFRLHKDHDTILKRSDGAARIIDGKECIPVSSISPCIEEIFWLICKNNNRNEYVYPVIVRGHYVSHEGQA